MSRLGDWFSRFWHKPSVSDARHALEKAVVREVTHVVEDSILNLFQRKEIRFLIERIAIDLTVIDSLLRNQQYQAARGKMTKLQDELEGALK